MADVNDLKVNNVTIKDDVDFRPNSFGKTITTVTYFVGLHGPFRLQYPKDQATSDRINSDIDHQVAEIRRVTAER